MQTFVNVCSVKFVCVCVFVSESVSLLPQEALQHTLNEVPWKGWREGGEHVFVLFARVCSPCFSPPSPFELWPKYGPKRPINREPAWPFGTANMRWPNVMFSPFPTQVPPAPLVTSLNPTQGISSQLIRLHGFISFHLAPWSSPLHILTPYQRWVLFATRVLCQPACI